LCKLKSKQKKYALFLFFFLSLFVLALAITPLIANAAKNPPVPEIISIQLNSLMSELIMQKAELATALKRLENSELSSKLLIEQLANYKQKEMTWQNSFNRLQQQVQNSAARSQELEIQLSDASKAMIDVKQLSVQFREQAEAEIQRLRVEIRKQKIEKWLAVAVAIFAVF
jgi:DNA anti-recombination protein RmuC